MNFVERFKRDLATAGLSAIREAGLIVVPASPSGSMIKAARKGLTVDLTDEEIEGIYFKMTNAWMRPPTP